MTVCDSPKFHDRGRHSTKHGDQCRTFDGQPSTTGAAGRLTFDIRRKKLCTSLTRLVNHALTEDITSGNQSFSFSVTVNGDTNVEPNETFFVNVTNVNGANVIDGQGVGTIDNDDSSSLPNLTIDDVSIAEGNGGPTTFTFTVSLSAPAPPAGVTFSYRPEGRDGPGRYPATETRHLLKNNVSNAHQQTLPIFSVTVNGERLRPTEIAVNVPTLWAKPTTQ